jgi:hypothetical protein
MVSCDGRVIGAGRAGAMTRRIIAAFHERTTKEGVRI